MWVIASVIGCIPCLPIAIPCGGRWRANGSVASAMRCIISTDSQGFRANRRFTRQHTGIGPVEDRVSHVGHFRPWADANVASLSSIWVAMITGLCKRVAEPRQFFWTTPIRANVDFHAQIAAGNHHAVGRLDDGVQVFKVSGFRSGDHLSRPCTTR